MHLIAAHVEGPKQKLGILIRFDLARAKKQPEPCIFCGESIHLQAFKGKAVCDACLQRISVLFICS